MAAATAESSLWVRRLRASAGPLRLVCFPHAGGAATYYAPLANALHESIDVVSLQYPGRQDRLSEPCIDSVEVLADAIAPELQGWLDGPFALFGHSMGGIVAYEVGRRLAGQGRTPLGLYASARRAPSTWRDEHVHRGGDRSLLREVARLAGTPSQLLDDEDVQQMMLPALRGDYRAIETYEWQPGPPVTWPIWASIGDADPLTTETEAAAWAVHTTAAFDLRVLPGGHFYFAARPMVLAGLVSDRLGGLRPR
ncbi:MAG: thioesterase II family protein [Acidimicrobiales bacterium]